MTSSAASVELVETVQVELLQVAHEELAELVPVGLRLVVGVAWFRGSCTG